MNQIEMVTKFSVEERKQFNLEMMKILEKYSKEEIETALYQLNKIDTQKCG